MSGVERLRFLANLLDFDALIHVVDVGANPIGGAAPYKELMDAGLCRVTGFEPHEGAFRKLQEQKTDAETYFNLAVGDGEKHHLNVYRSSGFTSIFKLNEDTKDLIGLHGNQSTIASNEELDTVKFDDIAEIMNVDYLKIDIQGGELAVFQNARTKMAKMLALQTEVRFLRLYDDEPDFSEVNAEIVGQGLEMHSLVQIHKWPIDNSQIDRLQRRSRRQLIDGDMVYVRHLRTLDTCLDIDLKKLALLADGVFGSFDLALRCIDILAKRDVCKMTASEKYLNVLPDVMRVPSR